MIGTYKVVRTINKSIRYNRHLRCEQFYYDSKRNNPFKFNSLIYEHVVARL